MRHRCVDRPGVGPALAATIALAAIFAGPAAGQTLTIGPYIVDPYQPLTISGTGILYAIYGFGPSETNGATEITPPSQGGWAQTTLSRMPAGTVADSGVALSASGALFGLASSSAYPDGFAYMLTPPAKGKSAWTFSHIHNFTGNDGSILTEGIFPNWLTIGADGSLYGTTDSGGKNIASSCTPNGCGVVFKLDPPAPGKTAWSETVLHKFTAGADGYSPAGGVVIDPSGAVYGTTAKHAVVYRLTPPASPGGAWSFATLCSLTQAEGSNLETGVILDKSGALYGTALTEGAYRSGSVFRVTPPAASGGWTVTVLYSFTGGNTGNGGTGVPLWGLTLGPNGQLYGEASVRSPYPHASTWNSTIYTLMPPATQGGTWTITFSPLQPGVIFGDGLVIDGTGTLYGTIYRGTNAGGNVFYYTP